MTKETKRIFTEGIEALSFRLEKEEYGVDILKVQEIRAYENVTRITMHLLMSRAL